MYQGGPRTILLVMCSPASHAVSLGCWHRARSSLGFRRARSHVGMPLAFPFMKSLQDFSILRSLIAFARDMASARDRAACSSRVRFLSDADIVGVLW